MDVAAEMSKRNAWILDSLTPLADQGDDAFQRKLLSVMKVNTLSPEGKIAHKWSTTCRAPHKWMFLWDGMMQTLGMNRVNPDLALDFIRAFLQVSHPVELCRHVRDCRVVCSSKTTRPATCAR